MKRHHSLYLFCIGFILILMLPSMFRQGMFLDGVTYASISKNLANGIGTFWKPHYTQTLYPEFYEHPPLVFIIQSTFFRLLGDGFLTEKIYSFSTLLLTLGGIWKLHGLFSKPEEKSFAILSVILFLSVPIISWSYKHNMLENTMGVFTIFSVYFLAKFLKEKNKLWILLGMILIVLAFFSKGMVGLFPLITPWVYKMIFEPKKWVYGLKWSFFLTLGVSIILAVLFLFYPEIKNNIFSYFNRQLLPALNNEREITTSSHFSILFYLLLELIIPVLFVISLYILSSIRKVKTGSGYFRTFVFFMILGMSASIPLMIVLKQNRVYLVPAVVYFTIGFTFLVMDALKHYSIKPSIRWTKLFTIFSISMIVFSLIYSIFNFGKYGRDAELLSDINTIYQTVPEGSLITYRSNCDDWGLIAYLARVGNYSVDCKNDQDFQITSKNQASQIPDTTRYEMMNSDLNTFILWRSK